MLPIFPQDTYHPQIISYLFRVESESKQHFEGKQIIRLISWPWIPTRSGISRAPLSLILRLSPRLNPRESICLHKILSLGGGGRTLTFFPPSISWDELLLFLLHTGISFTIVVPNLPVKPFWWPVVFSAASDEFVFCRKRDVCAVLYAQKGGGFSPVPSLVKLWVFCVNN